MNSRKFGTVVVMPFLLAIGFATILLGGPKTGLRAEILEASIPGAPVMYSGRLINRSNWPVRVNYCSFMGDTSSHYEKVAYIVERWDVAAKQWVTVFQENGPDFCKPRGLGMVETKRTSKLLWPGQSIPTWSVFAGRDGFNTGDSVRFAIYTEIEKQKSIPLATPEFVAR